MTDVDTRAQKLVELEKERELEKEARRKEQEEVSRLDSARKRIRQHDREREQEQARKEAAAEADALAVELGEQAVALQSEAEALHASIESYAELRDRLQNAQRRSGRGVGGSLGSSLRFVLPNWFRSVFGGHNSLVEVPSEMAGRARAVGHGPRTLAERDTLASRGTISDAGEAS